MRSRGKELYPHYLGGEVSTRCLERISKLGKRKGKNSRTREGKRKTTVGFTGAPLWMLKKIKGDKV